MNRIVETNWTRIAKNVLCSLLAATCVLLGPAAQAAPVDLVPTQAVLAPAPDASAALFSREALVAEFEANGLDARAARAQVAALTDTEVVQIGGQLDQLRAGGSSAAGVVLIVLAVLVITDFLGVTEIFPWIRRRTQN